MLLEHTSRDFVENCQKFFFVMLQYQVFEQTSKKKLGQLTHSNLQVMTNHALVVSIIPSSG